MLRLQHTRGSIPSLTGSGLLGFILGLHLLDISPFLQLGAMNLRYYSHIGGHLVRFTVYFDDEPFYKDSKTSDSIFGLLSDK